MHGANRVSWGKDIHRKDGQTKNRKTPKLANKFTDKA